MHDTETAGDNRSPAKLVLAIGLTVVFVAVVAVQIGNCWRDAEAADSENSNGSATDRLDADRSQFSGLNRPVATDKEPYGKWAEVQLSECIRYDPFATPDGFILKKEKSVQQKTDSEALLREIEIAKKRAAQEQVISSLRDGGVNAIFRGSEQSTAIVGSQMVRVGEDVKGFRVLAIEPDRIVIERPAVR